MEAVDLTFPVDVAGAQKFMGIEGLVRAGVTVKELEPCDLDRVSVRASPLTEACSSFLSDKEVTNVVSASEYEPSKLGGQLLSYQGEELSRHQHCRGKNGFLLHTGAESVQLERKSGKVSKMGSSTSKRPRIARLEDPTSLAGVDGIRDMSDKLGSYLTKCSSSDKNQSAKQKNNCTSKRGDKRNLKLHAKTKHDSFSVKVGLPSFGSAAGGNNFFGVHGLKSDNHDVTKLVDDVLLNELLDGTCKCPSLDKGKGKKPANVNDSFLHSVRKASFVLPLPRSVQPQHITEVDSNSDKIMSPWPLSTSSVVTSGVNGDNGEPVITDLSSCNEVQDSHKKPETPANPLDLPLCEPKYILERLALPPPKDLESLLLEAAKPALSSKSTPDPCSGKQISRRASLPPFPWSHTSNGHCRTSSDAAKLSISRATCQGRWQRIGKNIVSSLGPVTNNFTDLESLTYDQSLVPSARLKIAGSENQVSPSISVSLSWFQRDSSSGATCSKQSFVPLDEHCPQILAAARTLCDMATCSSRQNPDGIIRWPKKPSQKAMKARKLKSIEKPEEAYGTSVVSGSDNLRRSIDRIMLPPKKPRLSMVDDRKDFNNFSCVTKGPINWSTPRSSRSSPGKSLKESIVDIRHSTTDVARQSYMMPPPARVPEKASNKREKIRKLLTMEWNRGRDRLD
ncbi:hypothetical protein PRUPE_5G107200 [Prunus persica]|uniref:Uncharacterized protein n=1 Tax=Prunus persica TaxID=3760 RepID=A0A251P6L4_PRUPE|nr:uncharacterized protein LOC18776228 isoform X4 [Prunus persica]ONI07228.1 hypothetical protein PRUPE_5G107200 [Prunus persica]